MTQHKKRAPVARAIAAFVLAFALCVPVGTASAYTQYEQQVASGHGYNGAGYLVIHETANPGATAWNHVSYWSRNPMYAVHYVMDLDGSTVYHTMADSRLAYHVGNGNYRSVGIELCHATNWEDFASQWEEAIAWAGDYLNSRGWGIDRLISHNDARLMWGGTDHTDPVGYFNSFGKSWADFKAGVREYLATGEYSGTVEPGQPVPDENRWQRDESVSVTYELHQLGGGWLGAVTDSGTGSEGFAGMPYSRHDMLTMSPSSGELMYRVHVIGGGWLDWVYRSDKSDTINGVAGYPGAVIDGVQAYYRTAPGEPWQQVYYRSQTIYRAGYLATVCDDGTTYGGDNFAGMYGEPLDRLQAEIEPGWPRMAG